MSKKKKDKKFKKLNKYDLDYVPTYVDFWGVERWKSNGKRVHLKK